MIDVEKIIREYIDKTVHMSLATVKDNKPWVCEVHFAYDDKLNLYFVSRLDTRHCQEISANPFVAGNIIRQHDLEELPHGIYFEGKAEVIIDPSDEDISRYCKRLARDAVELHELLEVKDVRAMFKVSVKNWAAFGKFNDVDLQKYELTWNEGSQHHE